MMGKPKKYATATAFRRALEDRLRLIAETEKLTIERLRREIAFDRLLARLFASEKAPWVLKGGYALELRIKEARVTKDIDMALREAVGKDMPLNEALLATLEEAAALDLGDFFVFVIGPVMRDLDAAPYGGARFPVEARMDKRTFVEFHIDIGAGDVLMTDSAAVGELQGQGHGRYGPAHHVEPEDGPGLGEEGYRRDLQAEKDPSRAGESQGAAGRVESSFRRARAPVRPFGRYR